MYKIAVKKHRISATFLIWQNGEVITIWFIRGKQTKKEILPYPICSVVAGFKMLIRILNTLRSRIWDRAVFLFSDYLQLVSMGIAQKAMVFNQITVPP